MRDENTLWVKDGTMCQAYETEEFDEIHGAQHAGIRIEQVSNREALRVQWFLTNDDAVKLFYWLSRTNAIRESNIMQLLLASEAMQRQRLAAQDDSSADWDRLQESLHETPAETDPERG